MHYVTRRSHRTQTHKFGITCLDVLSMDTAPGPPEHEKYCVDVSCTGCTRMHYMTCRTDQMQKHKFDVMCPGVLFMETAPGPLEHQK
jgi:hypothetical protein